MKRYLYKLACYTFIVSLFFANAVKAQEVPPVAPVPPAVNTEAMPPIAPEIPQQKWEEFGKKFEKAFDGFDVKMKGLELSMVDFDKKLKEKFKNFDQNFKFEMPALPAMPEMPDLPEVPAFNSNFSYKIGAPENAAEKIKKLTKSYTVDANDVLAIENSYGRITVNTWDKNEIKVDVEVKAFAESEDDAQKLLDGVTIANSKTGDQIVFKTTIEKNSRGNSWMSISWWNNPGEKQKVDVYYTVYMPSKNALNLKTNYTNIILPDLNGPVSVSMNYGDLTAQKLSGNTNKLSSNYGKLQLMALNNATISCNYGSFKADDLNNLNANLNYSGATLGKLSGNNTIKMNYSGGFKITAFDKDFKSLNINANYSGVNLDLIGIDGFNFDINTNYASFKYDGTKTKITSKYPDDEAKGWSSSKQYKGVYGKTTDATIIVKSNYGSVKFN
ncbi:DUF4097 domain-containing protein [Pedobacter cryophilus]|uniref:DUF4097 domain-containing protein n=1 Tax=Pedobacter cryophilus TaxID=2571271 RepID=A0A4U1CAC3_9SPHI|nr:DUF4097 domain-containing protein [Pedobacter cryophilus]TKC00638.1 DUF4097 domain-containing protein [Pedobacter cryophilus]